VYHLGVHPKKISSLILRYPKISLNTNKSKDMYYGYERISLNGYHHGYQRISFFFYVRISSSTQDILVYILYILYIQQFIYRYPTVYPYISFYIPFILIYPHLIQPFYPFISLDLSLFILLVIRSGSRLIRLVIACCVIRTSFACPAQQQSKPLCFYFPAPRCGHHLLPLLAAPAPGPSPQRHRLSLLPAPPPGIGGGGGVGGSGERGRRLGRGE
jgi:hypothetical protein